MRSVTGSTSTHRGGIPTGASDRENDRARRSKAVVDEYQFSPELRHVARNRVYFGNLN